MAQSAFAKVVKNRRSLGTLFGHFNMRKTGSPWTDIRLRQAVNYAINRAHLIRYAAKGNGVIIPALVPEAGFGYDPDLAPYAFDPGKARRLLRAAGYPDGLSIALIAPKDIEVQAIVVSKMLEQVGLTVQLQLLDPDTFNQKIPLPYLDRPSAQQPWDIALQSFFELMNFPVFHLYHYLVLDGYYDWVAEQPEFRQLYDQVLHTVDRTQQQQLIRQMERHTRDQAYLLFLYNPIQLFAVNKAVDLVPYVNTILDFDQTSVSDQHWSVRKQKAALQEERKHAIRREL